MKFIAKNDILEKLDLEHICKEKICAVGIEFNNGKKFELRWDNSTKRLILWTEDDLVLKCKSGNTIELEVDNK